LKDRLRKGEAVVGPFVEIPSPQVVEVMGLAGFDFVIIDGEHGSIGLEKTEEMIRAASSAGVTAMARVAQCDPVAIRRPLDMGAAGIHVPQIESAEMARAAVRAAKFYPQGERGLQPFVRAAGYRSYPTAEFLRRSNEETMVVLHIEGERGVAGLAGILEVEGVDVVFLGPYDLSQALGMPGEVGRPEVREKMIEAVKLARAAGKVVGTFCDDVETALGWRELGVSYLAVGIDANIFLQAARGIAARLHE
jgi:4-hydroxy-2-oxoheptanedioate aldolase